MTKMYPTTRFVFDRKHVATKEKNDLAQLDFILERENGT